MTPTRADLKAAAAVLRREVGFLEVKVAKDQAHFAQLLIDPSNRLFEMVSNRIEADLAQSRRLASAAGWLQAEAGRGEAD